ncbi:MAG: tRNA (adenosine(37)-N6)-threonylcarbamoyltransferase complex dimerization subunit type 1 TsaB [Sphingomonadaceae bacterium]|nr:tRNA (adenosine(37)-N6)-threonylcarbamoyltransferase complex dimerization subunit type 1 TsaB [Sphingomonadaceae bacterium]MCP5383551.1 tRNA (adenosine(37)-N6)-threonylcarbamoyltransferase complex dimerization subunit type 1 TsaB [Altererythrobacter sp.]MCP5394493.1 tRNA (adenosine(37)-N6)-threonylcarbamoyltransferase complex dimerization subunit type 1 TsaB [Sphingomonadaceae bacterium]
MRTLAIDCATEACSVALFEGETLLGHRHEVLGRGHAERLVPLIASLPGKGKADRILVSRGPGSFTGVRIGIAAARALAFAWGAEISGYPTLALVAAQSPQSDPAAPVTVCMHGGHGEWFVQNFGADMLPQGEVRSLSPEAARDACHHDAIAGNRAHELAALFGADSGKTAIDMLPDARHAMLLRPDHLSLETSALYGRAPDARPQS